MMAITLLVLILIVFLLLHIAHAQKPCYYPDGTLAANHHPCLLDQDQRACCAINNHAGADYCLSSGLCRGRGYGFMWRDSCTDKDVEGHGMSGILR